MFQTSISTCSCPFGRNQSSEHIQNFATMFRDSTLQVELKHELVMVFHLPVTSKKQVFSPFGCVLEEKTHVGGPMGISSLQNFINYLASNGEHLMLKPGWISVAPSRRNLYGICM
jgi:hypothetical protein